MVPRARNSALVGVEEGVLLVRLAAPPVEGRANQVLVEFLAEQWGLRKKQIHLQSGEKSRHKVLRVEGLNREAFKRLVSPEREE